MIDFKRDKDGIPAKWLPLNMIPIDQPILRFYTMLMAKNGISLLPTNFRWGSGDVGTGAEIRTGMRFL